MKSMNNFSILVNSFDSFEDCWEPFFRLFSIYWPDYKGKIYLNTNFKDFSFENLNIISTQTAINEPKKDPQAIPWSECLIRALDKIDEAIVLYMQEDYFLKDIVKDDIINKYVHLMNDNPDIHCIHLTDQGVEAEKPSGKYETLWTVPKKLQYRISCQAALWRKTTLKQYLRSHESAWQFEDWGSKRAALLDHNFYAVDPNWCRKDHFEILPYVFTGVIRGKWFKEVVPLFDKHNIMIEYSIRGFFESRKLSNKIRLIRKLKRIPVGVRSSIDLFRLRFNRTVV
jgi:hypothetical protein